MRTSPTHQAATEEGEIQVVNAPQLSLPNQLVLYRPFCAPWNSGVLDAFLGK